MTNVDLNKLATEIVSISESEVVMPQQVARMLVAFKHEQENTAKNCLAVADALERLAQELKNKASMLNHQSVQVPDDLQNAIAFETRTRSLVEFLSGMTRNGG